MFPVCDRYSACVNCAVLHTSEKMVKPSYQDILVQSRALVLKTILFRENINMPSVSMAAWHTNDDTHPLPEAEDK